MTADDKVLDVSEINKKFDDRLFSGGDFRSDFDRKMWALTARQAQRMNAASVSRDEVDRLLKERQTLLDKKFAETMSELEAARLEYVEWSLDRIEDAQTGDLLDILESRILNLEDLVESIEDLKQQISVATRRG